MKTWEKYKHWSDRFIPAIKRILGEHLITVAPVKEDAERNTDLIVLKLNAVRIACRIRKFQYFAYHGHEFTIRSSVVSRNKTELAKICEGWGDYFFYGFANKTETKLHYWILGDLEALRHHINQCRNQNQIPWATSKNNTDYLSSFVVFRYNDIPNFLIAQSNISNNET